MADSGSADSASADGPVRDTAVIVLPASSAYLSVLRSAVAGLAARLDFTLDDIEDLRIAVDEACALLLADALPGTDLRCAVELSPGTIRTDVSLLTVSGKAPSRDTFAWTVLAALAGEVDAGVDAEGRVTLSLTTSRSYAPADERLAGAVGVEVGA